MVPDADGSGDQSPAPSHAQSPPQVPPVSSPVASPANPQGTSPLQGQGQSPRRSPRVTQAPTRLSYDSSDSSSKKKKKKSPSKKFLDNYKKMIAKGEKVSYQCIKIGHELGEETKKAKRYFNAQQVRRRHSISSSTGSSSHPSTSRRPPTRSPTSRQSPPHTSPSNKSSPKSSNASLSPKSARRTPPKDPARRRKRSSPSSSFQDFDDVDAASIPDSPAESLTRSSPKSHSSQSASPIEDDYAASAEDSPPQLPVVSPVRTSYLLPGAARAVPVTAPRWSAVQRRLSFRNTPSPDADVNLSFSNIADSYIISDKHAGLFDRLLSVTLTSLTNILASKFIRSVSDEEMEIEDFNREY
ncbi:uncharacterized protein LOC129233804 [Uloborus diversus]|uniref:uncharacterized protein LOC129233804 n=1 Tax=Uloborus diversus TaxID=327109 RepID=UPI00240A6AB0|nr:uncharacterized protein LOC129233804 [Uloborus diversus]